MFPGYLPSAWVPSALWGHPFANRERAVNDLDGEPYLDLFPATPSWALCPDLGTAQCPQDARPVYKVVHGFYQGPWAWGTPGGRSLRLFDPIRS